MSWSAAPSGPNEGAPTIYIRGTGGRPRLVRTSNTNGITNLNFFYLEKLKFVNTSAGKIRGAAHHQRSIPR